MLGAMARFQGFGMGSDAQLWALIEERTQHGADVAAIDRRIWDRFGEEWAIMFTDLAGFSRRAESFGIIHFLQVIYESKKLIFPIVSEAGGTLVKADGDSAMFLFRTPERAVTAAIAMQQACRKEDERRVAHEQILLCIGIGFGRILRIGEQDVWGEEVNRASKLGEDTASAYEVLVTETVRAACGELAGARFEDIAAISAGMGGSHRLIYDHCS
jgi:class 3 adenylate cyclase